MLFLVNFLSVCGFDFLICNFRGGFYDENESGG